MDVTAFSFSLHDPWGSSSGLSYVSIPSTEITNHLLIGETILVGRRIGFTPLLCSIFASQVKCAALTFHQPCHRKIDAPRKYPSLSDILLGHSIVHAYKTAGMVDDQKHSPSSVPSLLKRLSAETSHFTVHLQNADHAVQGCCGTTISTSCSTF